MLASSSREDDSMSSDSPYCGTPHYQDSITSHHNNNPTNWGAFCTNHCSISHSNMSIGMMGTDSSSQSHSAKSATKMPQTRKNTLAESIVYHLCDTYTSFASVERKAFKAMFGSVHPYALGDMKFSRKEMKSLAVKLAEKKTAQFLQRYRDSVAYITIDEGRIWHGYTAVCLHIKGGPKTPFVLRLIDRKCIGAADSWKSVQKGDEKEKEYDSDLEDETVVTTRDVWSRQPISLSPCPRTPSNHSRTATSVKSNHALLASSSSSPFSSIQEIISMEVNKLFRNHDILVLSVTTTDNIGSSGSCPTPPSDPDDERVPPRASITENSKHNSEEIQSDAGQLWPIHCACRAFQSIVECLLEHEESGFKRLSEAIETIIQRYEVSGIPVGADTTESENNVGTDSSTTQIYKRNFPPRIIDDETETTRWVSYYYKRIRMLNTDVENINEVKAEWYKVAAEHGTDPSLLSVLLRYLEKFHIASRLCEVENATMISLLRALSLIEPPIKELLLKYSSSSSSSSSLKANIDLHLNKLITPPLVITAFFTSLCLVREVVAYFDVPVDGKGDETARNEKDLIFNAFTSMVNTIYKWLRCELVSCAESTLSARLSPGGIVESNLSYFVLSGNEVTVRDLMDVWRRKSTRDEYSILMAIVSMRPSVANTGELLRRVKLTPTRAQRESLRASTVECMLQLNYLSEDSQTTLPDPNLDDDENTIVYDEKLTITRACVVDVLARATAKHSAEKERSATAEEDALEKDKCIHCKKNILPNVPTVMCQECGKKCHELCLTRAEVPKYWYCIPCAANVIWI